MTFELMHLPRRVPIAIPVEKDGKYDSNLICIMRDQAWRLLQIYYFPYEIEPDANC